MILIYFPSGGCVNDAVINQINHQFTSIIVKHFIILQGCVGLSEELFLMCLSV